ncbi:hypothetical protein ACFYKX_25315 [Cytobacillus sp. FJAT-54145]|uniref:Uncharacterized protein n=1 Tax=Cytobacillus spartinae TaxID=3299023 RepID=A0ABW6KKZ0_9BACI
MDVKTLLIPPKIPKRLLKYHFIQTSKANLSSNREKVLLNGVLKEGSLVSFMFNNKRIRGLCVRVYDKGTINVKNKYLRKNKRKDTLGKKVTNIFYTNEVISPCTVKELFAIKRIKENDNEVLTEFFLVERKDIIEHFLFNNEYFAFYLTRIINEWSYSEIKLEMVFSEMTTNETLTFSAGYNPEENKIILCLPSLYQHCHEQYIYNGLYPIEALSIVIAHELGHSEIQYTESFFKLKNRLKRLNNQHSNLVKEINHISPLLPGKEILKLQELQNKIKKLNTHYFFFLLEYELEAFEKGRKYIPDYYMTYYEIDNYRNFYSYIKALKHNIDGSNIPLIYNL